MHEFGIVKGILKKAIEEAQLHKGKKILKIKLKVGHLEMLTPEHLQDHFSMISEDSIAEDAAIEVEEFPGAGITIEAIEMEN
jgi:Zn finger protein HypA/HybF involved in hydrogenase expression